VTLIELMIVMVVLAILASIAYPSYQQHIIRASRADAQKLMVAIANRQSQYLLDARVFTDTIGPGGLNFAGQDGWACAATCANNRYTVAVTLDAGPPLGFTIAATPSGVQAGDGVMTLTSAGAKTRIVGGVDKGW
jgi:type IV pilus assembly protein PilE